MNLQKLKELRERKERYENQYKELFFNFQNENELLISTLNQIKEELNEEETELRRSAVTKYLETGNKQFGQVKIRLMSKLNYNEADALNWAINHKLALSLDKRAFEGIAKTQNLEFVTKLEEPSATLPTQIE